MLKCKFARPPDRLKISGSKTASQIPVYIYQVPKSNFRFDVTIVLPKTQSQFQAPSQILRHNRLFKSEPQVPIPHLYIKTLFLQDPIPMTRSQVTRPIHGFRVSITGSMFHSPVRRLYLIYQDPITDRKIQYLSHIFHILTTDSKFQSQVSCQNLRFQVSIKGIIWYRCHVNVDFDPWRWHKHATWLQCHDNAFAPTHGGFASYTIYISMVKTSNSIRVLAGFGDNVTSKPPSSN
jgi:hypothetical protein